jgi:SOS-response transcriptional repressor LexA
MEELQALPVQAPLPDWSHLSLGDRFAIALRLLPASRWQAELGKSKKQLDRYAAGSEIPMLVAAALARAAELPIDWIVSGRAMERKPPVVYVSADHPLSEGEDIALPKLAFRASAGRGTLTINEAAGHLRFPRAVLDHIGVKPQNARLLEASGNSMRPTINDGDLMVLDVSVSNIADGQIYLFSVGDEAYVKRLRRHAGTLVMVSDNRELYPEPEPIGQVLPFRLYGRIRWAGRNL